jgi:molybdopterin converting factor small subunit
MRIEVRLFASLERHAGPGHAGTPFSYDLAAKASIEDLITALGLSRDAIHLVLLNGQAVGDLTRKLVEGDRVGLFPPVGGG